MARFATQKICFSMAVSFLIGAAAAPTAAFAADYVLTNGKIYTVNTDQPWAEAVVVDDERITFVGDAETAKSHIDGDTEVIDLAGRMVLPGMIDTHVHPGVAALAHSLGVTLNAQMSPQDYIDAIKAYTDANPDATIIAGFGFIPPLFGPKGPTKEMIDAVVSDRPVFIISGFGHSAWANSKALEVLGITKDTLDPHEGAHFYRRDADGNPTGHLVEGGAFWSHLPALGIGDPAAFRDGYTATLPEYAKFGITSFFDAGTPAVQENAFRALREMEDAGALPVRYHGSYYIIGDNEVPTAVQELQRLRESYESELLRIRTIKVSNDGQSPERGVPHLLYSGDQLGPLFTDIMAADIDVMIHATNANTVHETLNGIEIGHNAHPDTDSRFNITHMDFIREADFDRYKALDVIAGVQPMAAHIGFVGDGRAPEGILILPLQRLIQDSVVVTGSSDFPACGGPLAQCTPFYGIEISVTRQTPGLAGGAVLAPESERLTLEQAIYANTMGSAYQLRRENDLGSIEAGKLADLIVTDQNLFHVDPRTIHQTQVLFTMMNGNVLHNMLQ